MISDIELLGTAGCGFRLLVVVMRRPADPDDPDQFWREAETLRELSMLMVAGITTIGICPAGQHEHHDAESCGRHKDRRIGEWLTEHDGTLDLTENDLLFFSEQLNLARRKVHA